MQERLIWQVSSAQGGSAPGGKTKINKSMYYVYILRSEKSHKLYRGLTSDLRKRLERHNQGKVKSTKNDRPWKLIYYEAFISKKNARREELFLKTGQGRKRIKYLFSNEIS